MSNPVSHIYSVDSSALIDLDKQYGPEFFGDLWQEFARLASDGRWMMSEKAVAEVQDPSLKAWIRDHPSFVQTIDDAQQSHVGSIMASHRTLIDLNKTTEDADPFVIALAMAQQGTLFGSGLIPVVLSSERPRKPNARPKIPDVCGDYNIMCCDVLGFFRLEEWRFRLQPG